MTPAERIAAALHRHATDHNLWMIADFHVAEPMEHDYVLDALMDGHTDMHFHRHPDGTITAVPMRQVPRAAWDDNGIVTSLTGELRHREGQQPMWVDSPGGAA